MLVVLIKILTVFLLIKMTLIEIEKKKHVWHKSIQQLDLQKQYMVESRCEFL